MIDWLEQQFREIIWTALADLYTDIASWTEEKIETELKKLSTEVGKPEPLASSPVVRVTAYATTADPDIDHITFLIRGRVPLFKGVESVFMRVEVTISTQVDLVNWDPPIQIVEWHTITGDLKISKKGVFYANLAFGYDKGSWLGRGALKILPAGFGLDIYLGGLNERGAMIGLNIDLPATIPLGSTGLGLRGGIKQSQTTEVTGVGGDFAYNFVPRLEEGGLDVPIQNATAQNYITWARDKEPLNRWVPGPINKTAVGVGLNVDLVTMLDNGHILALEPIGLAVITPGPVFVLGGVGKLLSTDSARIEGYIAVDIPSASMALGLGVMMKVPRPKEGDNFGKNEKYLLSAGGTLDAYFSFTNPSTWYVNLGTDTNKIAAKIITDIIRADLYLMLNNYRVAFGAGISIGGQWEWWIIVLTARLGADVAAVIGWNPVLLEGLLCVWAELGIKIWKFGFLLRGSAKALGHTPDPTKLDQILEYKLDLPWPIPDIEGDKKLTLGDETPNPPSIASPLLAGQSMVDGVTTKGALKVGLLHELTGRQWEIGAEGDGCWPDAVAVVPFSSRVTDKTGLIDGSAISSPTQGGYVVEHKLTKLALTDVTPGVPATAVTGVKAEWAGGPGGDTARLHVLGEDPFSWAMPHVNAISTTTETPARTVQQDFGTGAPESFATERRFGEILFKSFGPVAQLLTDFSPALPTRVLRAQQLSLRFRTWLDDPVEVDEVTFLLLLGLGQEPDLSVKPGSLKGMQLVKEIYASLHLGAVTIALSPATDTLTVSSTGKDPLLVYAVRYHEARKPTCNWKERVVLNSGGTYLLEIEGESKAIYPDTKEALPDSKTVTWSLSEKFKVTYPESLRPYIDTSTIGDSRIFDVNSPPGEPAWNPTMHGFGFPIYQKYQAMVRFRTDKMDRIFPTIRFRLLYETGEKVEQDLMPIANSAGESYLPEKSRQWIHDHCGTWAPDQEVTLTSPFVKAGAAAVRLFFVNKDNKEIKLDEWTCVVSQFDSFADHLAWSGNCITVFYGPGGRSEQSPSALPGKTLSMIRPGASKIGRIDPLVLRGSAKKPSELPVKVWKKPVVGVVIGMRETYPDELTEPPVEWRLSSSLTNWLAPLDAATGIRFACFASETGAHFSSVGDPLNGINDTVDKTTIEAIVDSAERPYALWLRTSEPVDWRRVTVSLRIKHIEGSGDCPTGYAKRNPLDLEIETLPSPDGSSAFLVGSLAGHRTKLPRGVYTLTLRFNTEVAKLPTLKPTPAVGGPGEEVIYTFVQPNGTDWPLPTPGIVIPHDVLERLMKRYSTDWPIIKEMLNPRPDPRALEEMLRARRPLLLHRLGEPDPIKALASTVGRLKTVAQRLDALNKALPGTDVAALAGELLRYSGGEA
jgi:hypothetical protein